MLNIELTEFKPQFLAKAALAEDEGIKIWKEFANQIAIDFPTPKTGHKWELKSKGWVGHIPLSSDISITLKPKIELKNLFLMLEYAYRLKSLKFMPNLMDCDALTTFYQHLAKVFARRVMDRGRRGFYHAYIDLDERLPFIRGKIDTGYLVRAPWRTDIWCRYQNHTADIVENQLLAWTLRCISQSGLCGEDVLVDVRHAYRRIQSMVQLVPFSAAACLGRIYNRLNDDYEPLHALCRFFLEHSGPAYSRGTHATLPFLVDMARLYELFVAEWLTVHLPDRFYLKPQEKVSIGIHDTLSFKIDLVIYEKQTGKPCCVADTKYKEDEKPSPSDFAQVVTYAKLRSTSEAILIYPKKQDVRFCEEFGDLKVWSLVFDLGEDLEKAGNDFLEKLLRIICKN